MREDPTQEQEFVRSDYWAGSSIRIFVKSEDPGLPLKGNSYSGNERNRLFLQRDGDFDDMTLVSGADFMHDSRSTVLFDYDQDGFVDMGVNCNQTPKFRLMRNRIGELDENAARFINIRLIGGQTKDSKTQEWSNRDGIGAKVFVHSGNKVRVFERTCGEGLAAQNSSAIHVGVPKDQSIDKIEVKWPSGKSSSATDIELGQSIEIREKSE